MANCTKISSTLITPTCDEANNSNSSKKSIVILGTTTINISRGGFRSIFKFQKDFFTLGATLNGP